MKVLNVGIAGVGFFIRKIEIKNFFGEISEVVDVKNFIVCIEMSKDAVENIVSQIFQGVLVYKNF